MMKNTLFAALLCAAAPAAAVTISNTPAGTITSFGVPDSQTYGQVFTAPVTGMLTSFTLSLNDGVGVLRGGVGTWNGPASFAIGFGSPTNLFLSGDVDSPLGGPASYTFTPNISVTAGTRYVAYLTVFGVPGAISATSVPLGTGAAGLNYFVWNNSFDGSSPINNPNWNYFADFGNLLFEATFSGGPAVIPEPESWAMLIAGFGLVGAAMRRRRWQGTAC